MRKCGSNSGLTLPNVAPYQLSHTRTFDFHDAAQQAAASSQAAESQPAESQAADSQADGSQSAQDGASAEPSA